MTWNEIADRTRGPATLQDFAWWSGLTVGDATRGVAAAGTALKRFTNGGRAYWHDPSRRSRRAPRVAHLLPNFDEYTVGYTDRSAIMHPVHPFRPELFAFSSILANIVTVAGQVVGAWRRTNGRDGLRVEVRPLARLTTAERAAVDEAGDRLRRFLERPVEVVWIES